MSNVPVHVDPTDDEALARWVESDDFDPAPDEFVDAAPLRRIAETSRRIAAASDQLGRDVAAAREAGMSWTMIGAALGVSRQAARQRFAEPAHR